MLPNFAGSLTSLDLLLFFLRYFSGTSSKKEAHFFQNKTAIPSFQLRPAMPVQCRIYGNVTWELYQWYW